jgi:DNA-binding CsgD family transcriptional regulator
MEKRPGNDSPIGKARHFLHCVVLEQRAATEELKASNHELERLLEEILTSRRDLRSIAAEAEDNDPDPPVRPDIYGRRVAELKKEVDIAIEAGAAAIRESVRLRKRSQRIRSALKPGETKQHLSKREHQVLTLIVDGKSSKEIAAELGISFKTAVTHRASIMSKLDVHEIASVVREAIRRGLV